MRNIWFILGRDLKRLLRVPTAWVIIFGLTFIKDGTIQHTGTLADFRQHYDYLRQPGQELTLEDIIVSVERRPLDENAIV